jgi:hypothetical protein
MKKLFLKRHCLFFSTLAILLFSLTLIVKDCFSLYGKKILHEETVDTLAEALRAKRERLPERHLEEERRLKLDLLQYRQFASETWQKMALSSNANGALLPANHVAMFFEISDYLTWAKESCDVLGVEFGSGCSFGFMNFFEKNEQPLSTEIYDIHRQKEQLKLLISYLLESRSSYLKIVSVERGNIPNMTYFVGNDVFSPEIRRVEGTKSYVYAIKFTAFTDSFRNFLKNLYANELPIALRQISVQQKYKIKLTKSDSNQILECLASTFSLIVEFLDVPPSLFHHTKKNAALQRKILYETSP